MLFRWDAPLFFANAEFFDHHVLEAVARHAHAGPMACGRGRAGDRHRRDRGRRSSPELDDAFRRAGGEIAFAELKGPVKDKLKRYGMFGGFGEECLFATIGEAVGSYVEAEGVKWEDWEDRKDRKDRR